MATRSSVASSSITSSSTKPTRQLRFTKKCPDCTIPMYRCSYPGCHTYVCRKSPEGFDSYFYKIYNKTHVVCIDCLPYVTINLSKKSIKIRNKFDQNSRILSTSTEGSNPTESEPSYSSDDDLNSKIDVFHSRKNEIESDSTSQTSNSSTTSKQSWIMKCGFMPLSTSVSILMNAISNAEKEKMS